jgi:hypothetical protein
VIQIASGRRVAMTTKPTRGVKKLLDRMGTKPLLRIYDAERSRWVYCFEDGTAVRTDVMLRAQEGGFIVPNNDALFESEQSQTWRKRA